MYELDFTLENPENSPWWMSRLIWLMDSAPDLALELWNSPKHEKLLERKVLIPKKRKPKRTRLMEPLIRLETHSQNFQASRMRLLHTFSRRGTGMFLQRSTRKGLVTLTCLGVKEVKTVSGWRILLNAEMEKELTEKVLYDLYPN